MKKIFIAICLADILLLTSLLSCAFAFNQADLAKLLDTNECVECDLSGADLSKRNLTRANLTKANLAGANLHGSSLKLADLAETDFRGANLENAQLAGADLYKANLDGASIKDASFDGAYLVGTLLERPSTATVETTQETFLKLQAQREKPKEPQLSAQKADESIETMTTSPPRETSVEDAQIAEQKTEEPRSIETSQKDDKPIVVATVPKKPTLPADNTAKKQPTFSQPISEEELTEEIPSETPSQLANVKFNKKEPALPPEQEKITLTDLERLLETNRCVECDLAGADLTKAKLEGAYLERANLEGANLRGANLENANLKAANLIGANLTDADLEEADLYKADLTNADFTGADLENAALDGAILTDTRFEGANLEGVIK